LNKRWVEPDVRDKVAFYVEDRSAKSGISIHRLVKWIGINRGKFYEWKRNRPSTYQDFSKISAEQW